MRTCPRCRTPLEEFHLTGGPDIDVCPSCHGAWYDQGELSLPAMAKSLTPGEAPCPVCGLSMYLGRYGDAGPELDYCTQCGGIWADKGEIEEIRRISGQAGLVNGPSGAHPSPAPVPAERAAHPAASAGMAAVSAAQAAAGHAPKAPARMHEPPSYGYDTCWWDEFLLYSPEQGYAWLVVEDGCHTLVHATKLRPSKDPFALSQKSSVDVGDRSYKVYEQGTAMLDEVEGEVPWIARPGETVTSVDLIDPPGVFSVEKDGEELEYFAGQYVDPAEVYKGFGLTVPPPAPGKPGAAQPFEESDTQRQIKWWSAAFAAVFLAFLVQVMSSGQGVSVLSENFTAGTGQPAFVSRPFEVRDQDVVFRAAVNTPLNNQWLWLDFDILDSKDQPVGDFSSQVSYYQGVEDGESWSEGSSNDAALFRVREPGVYKLRVLGEGGTEDLPGNVQAPVSVTLFSNYQPRRYFLVSFLIAFCISAWLFARRRMFEERRWARVIEDDDDDDD